MSLNLVELPTRREVPRDGLGRPLVVLPDGGKPKPLTRTTTFIDCIEDKAMLVEWGKRMVLVGAHADPSILDAVGQLDPEADDYKKRMRGLGERAMEKAGANDKREKGSYLHALSEIVDEKGGVLPSGVERGDTLDIAAYLLATNDFEMTYIERFVVCTELVVGGTPDRVMAYEGPGPDGKPIAGNFIGDLKTGDLEYGRLKIASQLAIYSRAKFYDYTRFPVDETDKKAIAAWKKVEFPADEAAAAYSSIGDVNQDWGIVIELPSGSGEATLHWTNLNVGWEAALLAQTIRKIRKLDKKALSPWCDSVTESNDEREEDNASE